MTGKLEDFIKTKLEQLQKLGVDVSKLELDHFAYQTSSAADFDNLKQEAALTGILKREAIVNGRRVAIFELDEPIRQGNFSITAFELLEPKQGQVCDSKLDHIEFVLDVPFQEFIKKHAEVDWDISMIDREEFPKVAYKFKDGTGLKFHLINILNGV